MDFHVWAKLDSDGRIQSVQSSCTNSPQGNSPVWPFSPSVECNSGAAQPGNDKSERVVPYTEKKELVYRLDAKVDEMSVIMTQLAELSKRVKVQEKLIVQYEEKLSVKDKQLKALEKENEMLWAEQQWTRRTMSLRSYPEKSLTVPKCLRSSNLDFKMVCNLEKSGRSSSWPGDNSFRSEHFVDPKEAKSDIDPDGQVDSAGLRSSCDDNITVTARPQSLKLGFDICGSLSGTDVDVEGHFNIHHRDSSIRNGYSYVKRQEQLIPQSTDLPERHLTPTNKAEMDTKEQPETKEKRVSDHPLGHVDSYGYLDMSHGEHTCPTDESVYSFSKVINESMLREKKQTEDDRNTYIDKEAIHSTWKDIKNGNVIMKEEDTGQKAKIHKLAEGYLEPVGCTNDYIAISDENVPLNVDIPPLPIRKVRTDSLGSIDSRSLDRQWSLSSSSSSNSDKCSVLDGNDRRTSLPVTSCTSSNKKSFNKEERLPRLLKTRSEHSFDLPVNRKYLESPSEERSPSNDNRKDDHLNQVFKDMRTTMEWNKAKKKLISKSTDNTVDKVEIKLRSTVQAVYEAYSILNAEKGQRLKRYTHEKIMERVKIKISKSSADNTAASEEFMRKCLDLVISTYPC